MGCVRLIPADNLATSPLVRDGQVVGELELIDAQNYCDVWFTPGSGQLTEEGDTTEQGRLYKLKLQLQVPRNAPDVAQGLAQVLLVRDFVVLCQDHNGYTYALGSPSWPMRANTGLDTGSSLSAGTRRTLQLQSDNPYPAAFYQHFAASAGARGVFSAGFSFGFQRTI